MNELSAENTSVEAKTTPASEICAIRDEIRKVLIGQNTVIDQVLMALLSAGHVLIEGVPGLGKTLLVRALANTFEGQFSRIQFTPDLMPTDITGHAIYDLKTEQFRIQKGPVFTNLLLADEINRAPAKTQAALLEVMQENQVTIEGKGLKTGTPFMVLATQNPIEQEGTYPLPESELDRFLMKIFIEFPEIDDEKKMVALVTKESVTDTLDLTKLSAIFTPEHILVLQKAVSSVVVDDHVLDYAVRIVRATRNWNGITQGAGPRGSIALIRVAKSHALLHERNFVIPDDVKNVVLPVLRHRINLSAELEIENVSSDHILHNILNHIEAPRT